MEARRKATRSAWGRKPVKDGNTKVPHTRGMFMREAWVEMRKPSPTVGEPKNSATMAPMSANVALTLSAPKMKGRAAGKRSARSVRG